MAVSPQLYEPYDAPQVHAQAPLHEPNDPVTGVSALALDTVSARPALPPPPQLTPSPASTATTPATSVAGPTRLAIPSIGVDTDLMRLGLNADKTLEVPPAGFPAGWYSGSPVPGELGPAVIAGHVDWAGRPGVFADLGKLSPGDEIVIDRNDGSTATFVVTAVKHFAKDSFPTGLVYGNIDHAGLRLITCSGSFDRSQGRYRDNLVVWASLVGG